MGTGADIGKGITIFIGILTVVFFIVSFPQIQTSVITSGSSVYGTQNIKVEIIPEDSRFGQWSTVCFRIDNEAQAIGSFEVPASNFKALLNTNAICKSCDVRTDFTTLLPQGNLNFCKEIQAPADSNELWFEVNTEYSALIFSPNNSNKFICKLQEETDSKNTYTCNV